MNRLNEENIETRKTRGKHWTQFIGKLRNNNKTFLSFFIYEFFIRSSSVYPELLLLIGAQALRRMNSSYLLPLVLKVSERNADNLFTMDYSSCFFWWSAKVTNWAWKLIGRGMLFWGTWADRRIFLRFENIWWMNSRDFLGMEASRVCRFAEDNLKTECTRQAKMFLVSPSQVCTKKSDVQPDSVYTIDAGDPRSA